MSLLRIIKWKLRYGSRFCVKLFCAKPVYLGKRCCIRIAGSGKVCLAEGVYFDDYCTVFADGGQIEVSHNCYFNTFSRLIAKQSVTVKEECIFGSNVSIYDHDHDTVCGVKNARNVYQSAPVLIESCVWCGTNVVVTRGITIQSNCVVGANAVVTHDLKENGVYAGIPAVWKKAVALPAE